MRSPLSGPIATLLMFVPLVAIPLLAVFGMPQFSTLAPTGQVEDLKFASDKDKAAGKTSPQEGDLIGAVQVSEPNAVPRPNDGTAPPAKGESDPFADFTRPAEGDSRTASTSPENQTVSGQRRPQHWPPNEQNDSPQKPIVALDEAGPGDGRTTRPEQEPVAGNPARVSSQDEKRSRADASLVSDVDAGPQRPKAERGATEAAKSLSEEARNWKAAVGRLNALGIRDYQLQPGEREGEFHFSCRFVSRSNPRVMQRFEAEAREPLQAVEQVLEQIDEWKGRRTNDGQRRSMRESPSKVTALTSPDESVPASSIDLSNR